MTESEYRDAIRAERAWGRIQVHQQFRALARELGLPEECTKDPSIREFAAAIGIELTEWQVRFLEMSPAQRWYAYSVRRMEDWLIDGVHPWSMSGVA